MGATIGVLALQGAVDPHLRALEDLGVASRKVRSVDDLRAVDALILPGGESTTMSMLADHTQITPMLGDRARDGMPMFGTCAGMILCAREIVDGRADQQGLGVIDIAVRRNAFGRQVDSFETDLDVVGLDSPFPAIFIRAPIAENLGEGVQVLARVDGRAVLCSQGNVLVSSFHPELSQDRRIHQLFCAIVD